MTLLDFLFLFSCSINMETVEKPKNKFSKEEKNQVLEIILHILKKIFQLEFKFSYPQFCLSLPLHLCNHFSPHNLKELHLLILVIRLCL